MARFIWSISPLPGFYLSFICLLRSPAEENARIRIRFKEYFMSILETTAHYTVTIQAPPLIDDPFELVQGAHFMQLLLARLRPRHYRGSKNEQIAFEQLARLDLLQEIEETS
jgi:hypothetical protein